MSVKTATQRGLENGLWTTADMARMFGLDVRSCQARVQTGDLTPTARTPGGFARWRRDDFARQVAPKALGVTIPHAVLYRDGSTRWHGSVEVTAQAGHTIELAVGGAYVYLLAEQARELAAILPSAIDVADRQDPRCTCRELHDGYGKVQMIVPSPTCRVHEGDAP